MVAIYKYFSADTMELLFKKPGFCGLRCSLPKDYNDPYELFLGMDLTVSAECMATYREIVQEIPQLPTTCFSKSPVISPMWAHYANNHSGFVIEFDSEKISAHFEEISIRDVTYRDEANPNLAASVQRAAVTKKPRHAVWLRQAVLSEAYFSKHSEWSYERECRLVDTNEYVELIDKMMILFVPVDCISSIIMGSMCDEKTSNRGRILSEEFEIGWLHSTIGKSQQAPFFKDSRGSVFVFDGEKISRCDPICDGCDEPVNNGASLCPWCSITEKHEYQAAAGNPFRILAHYGALDRYLDDVNEIEKGRKE